MSASEEHADEMRVNENLVARIASGDRDAETEFIRRYKRGVHVLVRRRCRPGDAIVEDLAQEVLARVLERLRAGAIRDGRSLPAYVQTTIVYMTGAEYRSRRPMEQPSTLENVPSDESPSERVSVSELGSLLRKLLKQMPVARDREILVRFYLDEEEKNDICQRLGIDATHFHRVVFRARERFRELLSQAGIREI
jgi:RNA polymerase sigma-70 factor (ECF subfamily)